MGDRHQGMEREEGVKEKGPPWFPRAGLHRHSRIAAQVVRVRRCPILLCAPKIWWQPLPWSIGFRSIPRFQKTLTLADLLAPLPPFRGGGGGGKFGTLMKKREREEGLSLGFFNFVFSLLSRSPPILTLKKASKGPFPERSEHEFPSPFPLVNMPSGW